jgi:3-hydroxybutyryl-CoA dehydrogenase
MGVMGAGVAQCLAAAGIHVVGMDLAEASLTRAHETIRRSVRFQGLFKKRVATESVEAILARIRFTSELEAFSEVDFVIENVAEKWASKESVYSKLESVCPDHCFFAADTSCFSITRLGALMKRPGRLLGIHFMNPAPLIDTVEVIRGYHTSAEALETAQGLLRQIGKNAIVVNDSPGFVSNRVLMPMINEAIFLVLEGVASPEEVDRIFVSCFGHKSGPLQTADLIGLDTILQSLEVLYESFSDSKFRPCPLLRKMVDAKHLGRKTGQGFYRYSEAVDHE